MYYCPLKLWYISCEIPLRLRRSSSTAPTLFQTSDRPVSIKSSNQICKRFTRSFNFRGKNLWPCPTFVPLITSTMREESNSSSSSALSSPSERFSPRTNCFSEKYKCSLCSKDEAESSTIEDDEDEGKLKKSIRSTTDYMREHDKKELLELIK